jgi:hypothetical protein
MISWQERNHVAALRKAGIGSADAEVYRFALRINDIRWANAFDFLGLHACKAAK